MLSCLLCNLCLKRGLSLLQLLLNMSCLLCIQVILGLASVLTYQVKMLLEVLQVALKLADGVSEVCCCLSVVFCLL